MPISHLEESSIARFIIWNRVKEKRLLSSMVWETILNHGDNSSVSWMMNLE
ncbi:hypothetical protein ABIE66_002441 [Peribacillus sp. B2I2]|uniref:hypothetical protein n=1 Tax=unclassified Peribacillus TaxID=2675266 RepID=UPI0025A10AFE|nr:hypothetical protein [Peribacillus sp. ACCC06369]MDM5358639.1 hypothetical protein [Peribacillus sp. ACCC06369]